MEMNYISEINAFEQWLETHYLPISTQLLWYKLMHICNRAGWSEWVTVDNLRLMAAMQMSREATLIKARDELIKAGLISYQRGRKGCPNRYHLIPFEGKNTFKSEVENEVKRVVESADIDKQRHKQNKIPPLSPVEHFEDFWAFFPNKLRRALTEQAYCDLLLTGKVTERELVESAKNYAEHIKITGEKMCLPNNYLEKCVFHDFLPGNYVKPKPKGTKNSFNNMDSRITVTDELERSLLG